MNDLGARSVALDSALVFRFIKFDDEGVRAATVAGVEGIEIPAQHAS